MTPSSSTDGTPVHLSEVEPTRLGPTGLPVLSAWDVAVGYPIGSVPLSPRPAQVDPDPASALWDALRLALQRPPCVVAFSGGRDSSLLLAVAADLAAREGMEPPTALTLRYPGDPAADESSWQELVIAHLRGAGLPFEWVRRDITTRAGQHRAADLAPRAVMIGNRTRRRIAHDNDCELVEPLDSPDLLASYAALGGPRGGIGRAAGTRLLAGGFLPDAVIDRRQKAYFNATRFGPTFRAFAREWDGRGVDENLVDPVALWAAWQADVPSASTAMLSQQAWLAGQDGVR